MTGIGLLRIAITMASIESRAPPGVSTSTMTAAAPPSAALRSASVTKEAFTWSIVPVSRRREM